MSLCRANLGNSETTLLNGCMKGKLSNFHLRHHPMQQKQLNLNNKLNERDIFLRHLIQWTNEGGRRKVEVEFTFNAFLKDACPFMICNPVTFEGRPWGGGEGNQNIKTQSRCSIFFLLLLALLSNDGSFEDSGDVRRLLKTCPTPTFAPQSHSLQLQRTWRRMTLVFFFPSLSVSRMSTH